MGEHQVRACRENAIAAEIAAELHDALGPVLLHQIGGRVVTPEAVPEEIRDKVGEVFGRVFDRHGIVTESAAACVLACVPRVLAKAELNRQQAMRRQGKTQ
jgi:hypothetical protein